MREREESERERRRENARARARERTSERDRPRETGKIINTITTVICLLLPSFSSPRKDKGDGKEKEQAR